MNRMPRSISPASASYRSAAPELRMRVLVPVVHPVQSGHAGWRCSARTRFIAALAVGVRPDHPRLGSGTRASGVALIEFTDVAPGRTPSPARPAAPSAAWRTARRSGRASPPACSPRRSAPRPSCSNVADVAPDVRLGVVREGLGASPHLGAGTPRRWPRRPAAPAAGRPPPARSPAARSPARCALADGVRVGPLGLLRGRAGQRVVQPSTQLRRQRGKFGQVLNRHVNGPVHGSLSLIVDNHDRSARGQR